MEEHFGDLGVDGRILLKWMIQRVCTDTHWIWSRIGAIGRLLWTL